MREFKVYIRNDRESRMLQRHLFNIGYKWESSGTTMDYTIARFIFANFKGILNHTGAGFERLNDDRREDLSVQEVLALETELIDKEFYVATTLKGHKWIFQKRSGDKKTTCYYRVPLYDRLPIQCTGVLMQDAYVELDINIEKIEKANVKIKEALIFSVQSITGRVFNEQTQMFEEPQHKNWRAKLGGKYKSIVLYPEVIESEQTESNNTYDKSCYETGNYYPIDEDIDWRIAEIKAIMERRDEQ